MPVEEGGCYYDESLLDYIHLSPVRAGLSNRPAGETLADYPWSSLVGYLTARGKRERWLAATEGLKTFDYSDIPAGQRAWLKRLERRVSEEMGDECGLPVATEGAAPRRSSLRHGWYWGSEAFSEQLLKAREIRSKQKTSPRPRGKQGKPRTRRGGGTSALEEGLAAAKLTTEDLPELPGSDVRKVAIAVSICQHTVLKMQWISDHLWMRSAANASQQIRRFRHTPPTIPPSLTISLFHTWERY